MVPKFAQKTLVFLMFERGGMTFSPTATPRGGSGTVTLRDRSSEGPNLSTGCALAPAVHACIWHCGNGDAAPSNEVSGQPRAWGARRRERGLRGRSPTPFRRRGAGRGRGLAGTHP